MNKLRIAAEWIAIAVPMAMLAGPAAADIGLSLVALLFLIRSAVTRDGTWLRPRWVQLFLLLIAFTSLRNLFMADDGVMQALLSAAVARYLLFAVALSHWLLHDGKVRTRLWWSLAIAVSLLAGDAIWQYFHHTDIIGRPIFPNGVEGIRLTGPFANPRVGITILWIIFPVLLPLLQSRRYLWTLLMTAGSGLAIYLSGERMALLLFIAGMGITFLCIKETRRVGLVAALATCLLLLAASLHDNTLIVRQWHSSQQQVQNFSQTAYGQTWHSALHIAADHPFFGVGRKQFQTACRAMEKGTQDTSSLDMRCPMHAHSTYLEWLVQYGAIGLGLFLVVIGSWVVSLAPGWRQWRHDPIMVGLAITLVLRLWPISATPSQFVPWSAVPFWLVVGWLFALHATRALPRE